MSEPFVGEVRMFAGNFAPQGWAFCDGQLLAVSQNDALFSLLGTIYGGDGETTFGLPDLRGRIPVHAGSGPGLSSYRLGEKGGAEEVTLVESQLPVHTHAYAGVGGGASDTAAGNTIASGGPNLFASPSASPTTPIGSAGGGQPHGNRQPFVAIHFIIALFGIYPSRT